MSKLRDQRAALQPPAGWSDADRVRKPAAEPMKPAHYTPPTTAGPATEDNATAGAARIADAAASAAVAARRGREGKK